MGKNGQIRITSRVSTFHLRINWRHKRVTLNDLFQESNRATISGRGGRERGGRRGGGGRGVLNVEKLESNFAYETTTAVVSYFYAYARARARLQVHDRKLNTVEGP